MKNVLVHNGTSQQLLSNVDDGSNTIFINDVEIPSSSWVGSGYYSQVINGTTITIAKISILAGNIMMQQIAANQYVLKSISSHSGSGNTLVWSYEGNNNIIWS